MIRRLLQAMDPQPLTAAVSGWLASRSTAGTLTSRRAIAQPNSYRDLLSFLYYYAG
jgi:hypothetical protein